MKHDSAKGKIKVSPNGPYLVSGGIPLATQTIVVDSQDFPRDWRQGQTYPQQESYALCRCGRSSNQPYCDGTHTKFHFHGTETASREPYLEQAEAIEGPALTLTDAESLCAGAGFCDRAGGTWHLTRESGDPESRRIAVEEAGNCPSGRLVAWDEEGNALEPDFKASIGVVEDPREEVIGPFWVRGGIPIEAADGTVYEVRNRVTLCRCGKSSNKPFCDGSHG